MLTVRQKESQEFINSFFKKHLRSPSHKEMREKLGITSTSYLNRTLDRLENLRFIRRTTKNVRYNIEPLPSPFTLPILGKIAAGSPIEALNQQDKEICIKQLLGEDRFLLEVTGNSMIEENICDGDLIICEKCQRTPPNGTIIVALINKQESTLKKIYYEKGNICLKPANKNYSVQNYKPEEVEIQGKFIGLLRLV